MQNLQLAEVHPSIQHESCPSMKYGFILVRFNVAWYVLNSSYKSLFPRPYLLKDHLSFLLAPTRNYTRDLPSLCREFLSHVS
jgi:hypothetical protein